MTRLVTWAAAIALSAGVWVAIGLMLAGALLAGLGLLAIDFAIAGLLFDRGDRVDARRRNHARPWR